MSSLQLSYAAPRLLRAHSLALAVPGTYRAGSAVVHIEKFAPTADVFVSKQRPRKLTVHGSDGRPYAFLLKGHEDLRQAWMICACIH